MVRSEEVAEEPETVTGATTESTEPDPTTVAPEPVTPAPSGESTSVTGSAPVAENVVTIPAGYFLGVDSAVPPTVALPDGTEVQCFYIGGDTPDPWSKEQIAAIKAQYAIPIWTRSNPASVNAANEAQAIRDRLAQLHSENGYPEGKLVILDMEEATDANYVQTVAAAMPDRIVGIYGVPTVVRNAPPSGIVWGAIPGATSPMPGWFGTQFEEDAEGGQFDLSWFVAEKVTSIVWDKSAAFGFSHAADGSVSLATVAAERGTTLEHLVSLTEAALTSGPDADAAKLAEFKTYVANHMPEGLVYFTSNP